MFIQLLIHIILLYYLPYTQQADSDYITYGTLVNTDQTPLQNLNLTLEYPSISLDLTNVSDSEGGFYFEFSYTTTTMLTGILTITDPLGIYETYIEEVDNYLGTNFISDLGQIVLKAKILSLVISGVVYNRAERALKNVVLELILENNGISSMNYTNYTDNNGIFSFNMVNLSSDVNYTANLNLYKRYYINKTLYYPSLPKTSLNITLDYVLRKGLLYGRIIDQDSGNGIVNIPIFIVRSNSKNYSFYSGDGGFFTALIPGIREINKKVNLSVEIPGKSKFNVSLTRKRNYSADLGELSIEKNLSCKVNFTGGVIDGVFGLGLENVTVELLINNTRYKAFTNITGNFSIESSLVMEDKYYIVVLYKKHGFISEKLALYWEFENISQNLFNFNETILKERVFKKTYGRIEGNLIDRTLNRSFLGEDCFVMIKVIETKENYTYIIGNQTDKTLVFEIKGLLIENNYTLKVIFRAKNYKKHVFSFNLTESNNHSSINETTFGLERKKITLRLYSNITFIESKGLFYEAMGSLTFYSNALLMNSFYKKTYKNYTMEGNNTIMIIIAKVVSGLSYNGTFKVNSLDYSTFFMKDLFFNEENSYNLNITVLLQRRMIKGIIRGYIRDSLTLLPLSNISIIIEVFESFSNKGRLIKGINLINGSFLIEISRFFLEGLIYETKVCFLNRNYSRLCENGLLMKGNRYSLKFFQVLMKKKIIWVIIKGIIIENTNRNSSDNTSLKAFLRINKEKTEEKRLFINEKIDFKIGVYNISFIIELFIAESLNYEAQKTSFLVKTNVFDLGTIIMRRKSFLYCFKGQILNRIQDVNIEKRLVIRENNSNLTINSILNDNSTEILFYIPLSPPFDIYSISFIILIEGFEPFNLTKELNIKDAPLRVLLLKKLFYLKICTVLKAENELFPFERPVFDIFLLNNKTFEIKNYKNVPSFDRLSFIFNTKSNSLDLNAYIQVASKGLEKKGIFMTFQKKSHNNIRNCSIRNVLLLRRNIINLLIKGVFLDFDRETLFYTRIVPFFKAKGILKPLLVMIDGSFEVKRKWFEGDKGIVYFMGSNETGKYEIYQQIAIFNSVFNKNEIIALNMSKIMIRYKLKGYVRSKYNRSIENVKIYAVSDRNKSFLIAFTNKKGFFYIISSVENAKEFIFKKPFYKRRHFYLSELANITELNNETNITIRLLRLKRGFVIKGKLSKGSILNYTIEIKRVENSKNYSNSTINSTNLTIYPINSTNLTINTSFIQEKNGSFVISCYKCIISGKNYKVNLTLYSNKTIPKNIKNIAINRFNHYRADIGLIELKNQSIIVFLIGNLSENNPNITNITDNRKDFIDISYIYCNIGKRSTINRLKIINGTFNRSFILNANMNNSVIFLKNNKIYEDFEVNFQITNEFINLGTVFLVRKPVFLLINGSILSFSDGKQIENATITIKIDFLELNSYYSDYSDIKGEYSIEIALKSGIFYNITVLVHKKDYKDSQKHFKNIRIYNSSSFYEGFLDFYLRSFIYEGNITLNLTNIINNEIFIIEIVPLFSAKIKGNTSLNSNSTEISFNLSLKSPIILFFVRFSKIYQNFLYNITIEEPNFSLYYNISLTPLSINTKKQMNYAYIRLNFYLNDLETGIRLKKWGFTLDCGFNEALEGVSDDIGAGFLIWRVDSNRNYLCLLGIDGFIDDKKAFLLKKGEIIMLYNETTLNNEIFSLFFVKSKEILLFFGKLLPFSAKMTLSKIKGRLFIRELFPLDNNSSLLKHFTLNMPFKKTFTIPVLLNKVSFYEIKLEFFPDKMLEISTNLTFYYYNNKRQLFLGNFMVLPKYLNIITIQAPNNDNDKRQFFLTDQSKSKSSKINRIFILDRGLNSLLYKAKKRFKLIIIGLAENNKAYKEKRLFSRDFNTEFPVYYDWNLSNMSTKPYFRYEYSNYLLFDNKSLSPMTLEVFSSYNIQNITKNNETISENTNNSKITNKKILFNTILIDNCTDSMIKSKGNPFGAFKLAIPIAFSTISFTISLQISSDLYLPPLKTVQINNNLSALFIAFVPKPINVTLFGEISELLVIRNHTLFTPNISLRILISPNISFSTLMTIINHTASFTFQITLDNFSPLNLTLLIVSTHYKPIHEDQFLTLLTQNSFESFDLGLFKLMPKRVKCYISGYVKPYNLTSFSLIVPRLRKSLFFTKNSNLVNLMLETGNSSLVLNKTGLNTSFFSFSFHLDPSRSPFLAFLLIMNEDYRPELKSFPLMFSNGFSKRFEQSVKLRKKAILFIEIWALFEDGDLSNAALQGIKVSIELNQETKGELYYQNYSENLTSGIFNLTFQVYIDSEYPLSYNLSFYAIKKTFVPYSWSLSFSFLDWNTSSSSNLYYLANYSSIVLSHFVKVSTISGSLMDKIMGSYISSAILISTMTCIDTDSLELIEVTSGSTGGFTISDDIYEGFSYSVVLEIEMDDFANYYLELYLNITNDYVIELGDLYLLRESITGSVTGSIFDGFTNKAIIGGIVYLELSHLTGIIEDTGAFSITFDAFEGLEYDETVRFPIVEGEDSFIYEGISRDLVLDSDNSYSVAMGSIYCYRKNITAEISAVFERDFMLDSSMNFILFLNISAGGKVLYFASNVSIPAEVTEVTETLKFELPIGLNFSCTLLVISDDVEANLKMFVLNTENNYTGDLGVIEMEIVTEKTTIIGQILDSSDDSAVVNASIYVFLVENNTGNVITTIGITDEDGNFSVTAKISTNSTKNQTVNLTFIDFSNETNATTFDNYTNISFHSKNSNDSDNITVGDLSNQTTIPVNETNNTNNDSYINNSKLPQTIQNSYFASVTISKLFYITYVINFTIFGKDLSEIRFLLIDLDSILLTPDYTEGYILGYLIDAVTNEVYSDQIIYISILDSSGNLLSLNEMTSDDDGSFGLEGSFEKGKNYIVYIEVDITDFDIYNTYYQLNVDNSYSIDIIVFLMREKVIGTISGVIIDNYTLSPLEGVSLEVVISFYRNSDCLFLENDDNCTGFAIFSNSTPFSVSQDIVVMNFSNNTNSNGIFYQQIQLWSGISYGLTVKLSKEHYKAFFFTNSSLSDDNDYEVDIGDLYLSRNNITGMIDGFVFDLIYGIALRNASLDCIVVNFEIESKNITVKNGAFQLILYGLLEGYNYSLSFEISHEFFEEKKFSIEYLFNEDENSYYLNKNFTLNREKTLLTVSGILISQLSNNTVAKALILGYLKPIFKFNNTKIALNETFSDKKGVFIAQSDVYQGVKYKIYFNITTPFPFLNRSKIISIYTGNSTFEELSLNIILIQTQKIFFNIFGILQEYDDKHTIPNANISLILRNKQSNCTNLINCTRISNFIGQANSNGTFNIAKKVFVLEEYEFFLRIRVDFFKKKKKISGMLNIKNNYTNDLSTIYLRRNRVNSNIIGNIYDNLTNKSITGYYKIRYFAFTLIGGVLTNFLNYTNNKSLTFSGEYSNLSTSALNFSFMIYQGKSYDVNLLIIKADYEHYEVKFALVLESNYTMDLNTILMQRIRVFAVIGGVIIDNITNLGVRKVNINITISPYTGSLIIISNKTGNFSENISFYEGVSYYLRFRIKQKEFISLSRSLFIHSNFFKKNPNPILFLNFSMIRKNVSFYISGFIRNDDGEVIKNAKIKATFPLNPLLGIDSLVFKVKSNSSGGFIVEGMLPNFLEMNCTLKISKSDYSSVKIKTKLRKLLNYTLIFEDYLILSSESTSVSGESSVAVSSETEEITLQVISYDSCNNNALIYVANANVFLLVSNEIILQTSSDQVGMVVLKAPLVFVGNSVVASTYQAIIEIEKSGFYEKEIEVEIGGSSWEQGVDLGDVELIQNGC